MSVIAFVILTSWIVVLAPICISPIFHHYILPGEQHSGGQQLVVPPAAVPLPPQSENEQGDTKPPTADDPSRSTWSNWI